MTNQIPEWSRAGYDGPTPPLAEFVTAYGQDDNIFWCLAAGHHQNLLDDAIEETGQLRAEVERLRPMESALAAEHAALVSAENGHGIEPRTAQWIRDGLLEILGEPDGAA